VGDNAEGADMGFYGKGLACEVCVCSIPGLI